MSTRLTTGEFRVSYPTVFKPKKNDLNGQMEFSVTALFKKGEDLSKFKVAAKAAIEEKWGTDKNKWPKNLRSPFRDQADRVKTDDKGKDFLPAGHEAGAIYVGFKSYQKPGVVDQHVQPIIDESEFYGGCYARATINASAYDHKGNRGVSFWVQNIQKMRDGEAFGNRSKPEDDFSAVEMPADQDNQSASDLFN